MPKMYQLAIDLTLYRTVAVPDDVTELEDVGDHINFWYTNNQTMKEAIDDMDFDIHDTHFWQSGGGDG